MANQKAKELRKKIVTVHDILVSKYNQKGTSTGPRWLLKPINILDQTLSALDEKPKICGDTVKLEKLLEKGLDLFSGIPDTQTSLRYDSFCAFDAALSLCRKINTAPACQKPVCPTCGGSKKVPTEDPIKSGDHYEIVTGEIPCPDCQQSPETVKCEHCGKELTPPGIHTCNRSMPPASEFAKKIREETLQLQLYDRFDSRSPDITYSEVFKLCDLLDAQQQRIAKGGEALKVAMKHINWKNPDTPDSPIANKIRDILGDKEFERIVK